MGARAAMPEAGLLGTPALHTPRRRSGDNRPDPLALARRSPR